jgi:DNA-directed RNA polymerase specialized sigma24 family protein
MEPRHPERVKCAQCGIEVERILWEEPGEWLCPDCDPDKGENEPEHENVWDDAVEDGITPDYIKPGWGERKVRTPDKEVPEWATSLEGIQEVVQAHPQANRLAERWALVVYYYYRLFWPAKEVGKLLGLSAGRVKRIIRNLDARAEKMRAVKNVIEMPTPEEMQAMSVRQLAAKLGCSVGKAHTIKRRAVPTGRKQRRSA